MKRGEGKKKQWAIKLQILVRYKIYDMINVEYKISDGRKRIEINMVGKYNRKRLL